MERTQLVMTALGQDRTGIVDTISKYVFQYGGNIEDTRMTVLGSEFAMIMLISGSKNAIEDIQHNLSQIEKEAAVSIVLKKTTGHLKPKNTVPYKITVTCLDHPGVVHQISSLLAARQINIESMETTAYEAPLTGSQLFRFEAIVAIPPSISVSSVRKELERLADENNFDAGMEAALSNR
jgi:glycine cleavage system transcriptional repressor